MSVKIFFCYAHADEDLLMKLKSHLSPLLNQGLIDLWHDRDISAGSEWEQEIKEQMNAAQIILLLVSPDFMASKYINNVELKRALERHKSGEASVIPIILRPCYWQIGGLDKLLALPTDAKPIQSSKWNYQDEAFHDVAHGIHEVIEKYIKSPSTMPDGEHLSQLPIVASNEKPLQPSSDIPLKKGLISKWLNISSGTPKCSINITIIFVFVIVLLGGSIAEIYSLYRYNTVSYPATATALARLTTTMQSTNPISASSTSSQDTPTTTTTSKHLVIPCDQDNPGNCGNKIRIELATVTVKPEQKETELNFTLINQDTVDFPSVYFSAITLAVNYGKQFIGQGPGTSNKWAITRGSSVSLPVSFNLLLQANVIYTIFIDLSTNRGHIYYIPTDVVL